MKEFKAFHFNLPMKKILKEKLYIIDIKKVKLCYYLFDLETTYKVINRSFEFLYIKL